jgi:hypothetical protein
VDEAIAILTAGAGTQWDRGVVEALISELPGVRALHAASWERFGDQAASA